MSSATIAIRARRPRNMQSIALQRFKNGGESCVAHYFQVKYWEFQREKIHGSQGWLSKGDKYAEVGYEQFYCATRTLLFSP